AEILNCLKSLDIDNSSWTLKSTNNKIYLIRKEDVHKYELITNPDRIQYASYEQTNCPPIKEAFRGVILITTNQSDIVEINSDEVLTLLLEGANVMIYNNPGKGLSKGEPSTENINSSIEVCYKYLQNREIPDFLILAK